MKAFDELKKLVDDPELQRLNNVRMELYAELDSYEKGHPARQGIKRSLRRVAAQITQREDELLAA